MRPLIIALGRGDNHILLAAHAQALGVEYQGLEGFEASELLKDHARQMAWMKELDLERPTALAVIDGSVSPATLRSLAVLLEGATTSQFFMRTDAALLERLERLNKGQQEEQIAQVEPGKRLAKKNRDSSSLFLLSVVRSPHGQIAAYPMIPLATKKRDDEKRDDLLNFASHDEARDESLEQALASALTQAREELLVGVISYLIDSCDGSVLAWEFGASSLTFWSESAAYTSISEQMVRAILDLPLGDTRIIDFEEFFRESEVEVDSHLMEDPTRPFLHLFARNPRLRIRYLSHVDGDYSSATKARISLFASSAQEAEEEMAHAREFMIGK